ncbi:sugar porter family MFS transporter [Clostridium estertheticum]|uniref:sugar porter family MFS transporter n=1 Tax=Clostridium estertheticum TaxID=238834 RepID=UPI001C7D1F31|nr:sugar porter family MFS transporter [Clostridium estertheticum]MBX4270032.1 sugar porter family MFS transporter [Clostridium estertheticum]WLC80239.1 sugar porter family MFS transporter [Clostridium estertheticum]
MTKVEREKGSIGFIIFISIAAAFGGLLYGYDSALISGAIDSIQAKFQFGSAMVGFVVSSILIGGAIGVLISGSFSDWIGRKKILQISALLFIVASGIQAISPNVTIIILARLIGGLGIGMSSVLSVAYISEVAPAHMRGRLGSAYQFACGIGIITVFFVNAGIMNGADPAWKIATGWRVIVGLGAVPALLYLLVLLPIPESPRWLIGKGRSKEAKAILEKINGTVEANKEVINIENSIKVNEKNSWADFKSPKIMKALKVGIILAVLQQLVGINVIIYYAPQVFKAAGAKGDLGTVTISLIGISGTLGVICSMWLIDKLGRKKLLMGGSLGMACMQLLVGASLYFNLNLGILTSGFIIAYLFLFNVSMGPVVWVILGEIFPNKVRGRAMAIATFCMWVANWLISQLFPMILARFGGGGAFGVFGIMCIVSFFYAWLEVPETKDKTLEEMEGIWM